MIYREKRSVNAKFHRYLEKESTLPHELLGSNSYSNGSEAFDYNITGPLYKRNEIHIQNYKQASANKGEQHIFLGMDREIVRI